MATCQNASHQALVGCSRVRQAEGHANVAVWWTRATPHTRRPEALLRRDSIEPWVVDADAQPTILAWMGSYAGQAAVAAHDSRFLQLLNDLGDELLRVGPSLPYAFLRETCREERLQVVPERLPHDLGKVRGPPGESPRAFSEEGTGHAFLCDGGWRTLDGRMSGSGSFGGACLLRP